MVPRKEKRLEMRILDSRTCEQKSLGAGTEKLGALSLIAVHHIKKDDMVFGELSLYIYL
jgi:hypothetical protein